MTGRDDTPSIREIAALTARLRELAAAGRNADPAERAAFQADKDALLARIDDADPAGRSDRSAAGLTNADEVLARAATGGYAMVGPSARTWSVDPATGVPVGPVPEVEHRLVRDLIAQERLDGAQPRWLRCDDGGDEIVAAVVPVDDDGWFTDGCDDAHSACLDDVNHADGGLPAHDRSEAVAAVEEAHQAVTPLTASCQRASVRRIPDEATMWERRGQCAAADDDTDVDEDGWSR